MGVSDTTEKDWEEHYKELSNPTAGCEYYKDGCCRVESNEEELSREILKLNEEIKLLRSDNQSLKNMIVKMCYERYGE